MSLKRHYPDFELLLNQIPDHRKRNSYEVSEIIMAGLTMFIFKRGSRNNADVGVRGNYEKNYVTIFGMKLPIMDTVDDFLRKLPPEELAHLKQILVQKLIEKKVLSKWKSQGNYLVAVDATGIFSFDKEPFEGCPHKTSKNNKKTWQAYVLEAKIVCSNGFSISIASEWLCNSENISDKQDSELKAFRRLSEKLKKCYPRLPITILADGLYPNKTVFDICEKNQWNYILTFKEGNLKTIWKEVNSLIPLQEEENRVERSVSKDSNGWLHEDIMFINDLDYKGHKLNWVAYRSWYKDKEVHERFVHLSDMSMDESKAWDYSEDGRLRWNIENQGFNTQKNDYKMNHKFSRKHFGAMQNYYSLLQIAHLINQLTEKLQRVKELIESSGMTIKAVWEDLLTDMKKEIFRKEEIKICFEKHKQLRYSM